MYYCPLCKSKFKLHKQAVFKIQAVEYASLIIYFFWFLTYVYFDEAFFKKFTEKKSFF